MIRGVHIAGLLLALFPGGVLAQFTEWSTPMNMGPVVNSPYVDSCVTVSKNGLSMFFFSNRIGCLGSILISAILTVVLLLIFSR